MTRYPVPQELFIIELKLGGFDVTGYLASISITFSIMSTWPVIHFTLLLDPADSLTDTLLRQTNGYLSIFLTKEVGQIYESILRNYELFILMEDTVAHTRSVSVKMSPTGSAAERVPVHFSALPKNAVEYLSKLVNKVYENKKIKYIIEDLAKTVGINLKLKTTDINQNELEQVVIPPISFVNSLRYLDSVFGVYHGPMFMFYMWDDEFRVESLHANMLEGPRYTIYVLASDYPDLFEIINKCTTGKDYYTITPFTVYHKGHEMVFFLSDTNKIITSPKDTLYHKITKTIDEFSLKSISEKPLDIDLNIRRTKYIASHTGYEKDDTFADARLTRAVSNLSEVRLWIERNVYMYNLTRIGEPVLLYPLTVEYGSVGEKYLLKASTFSFDRLTGGPIWFLRTEVTLLRTPVEMSRSTPV